MKTAIIDGREFYTRANPNGYGYQIMEKVPIEGRPDRFHYHQIFCSKNKELVGMVFKHFENGKIVTDFPDTSEDTYPEKIFVYNSRHFTGYYHVPTYKALVATVRHILKEEYADCLDDLNPEEYVKYHNKSGVETEEEIDLIPIEKVKVIVREKWNEYQLQVGQKKEDVKHYKNLRRVILEDKGDPFAAMQYYQTGNYDYEELTIIDATT